MKLVDFIEELQSYSPESEIYVEDNGGWKYDFMIAEDDNDMQQLTITPLWDTKRDES